jgi:hypothetical protein
VQDATVVRNQELGDCCDHTFACEAPGSAQKQDGGVHCCQSYSTGLAQANLPGEYPPNILLDNPTHSHVPFLPN